MALRDSQLSTLNVAGKEYDYYRIDDLDGIDHLPYSLKVLVENLVRNIDGANITDDHVRALLDWDPDAEPSHEIQFTPSRVVMQDFTGVPCVVDLATMRDAVKALGGDPQVINPQVQSDMVIDHSVQIDNYGVADAIERNMDIEYRRNRERYQFLRWGQQAFRNFRVVPPGTGIIHQVNIEYLAQVVMRQAAADSDGRELAYLDSCVGTDDYNYHDCLAQYGFGSAGAPEGLRQQDYTAWEDELFAQFPVSINGEFMNYSSKYCKLQAGDVLEFLYTCSPGDVGNIPF